MTRVYITADFQGDYNLRGFRPGEPYHLQVTQEWFGRGLKVIAVQGHYQKDVKDLSPMHYDHLAEFLTDWKIVSLDGTGGFFGD